MVPDFHIPWTSMQILHDLVQGQALHSFIGTWSNIKYMERTVSCTRHRVQLRVSSAQRVTIRDAHICIHDMLPDSWKPRLKFCVIQIYEEWPLCTEFLLDQTMTHKNNTTYGAAFLLKAAKPQYHIIVYLSFETCLHSCIQRNLMKS